jgi:hypothetical protein
MVQSVGMIDEYEDTKVNDYFSELWIIPRPLHMQGKHSNTELHL